MAFATKVKPALYCQAATAASTGITVTNVPAVNICTKFDHYSYDGIKYRLAVSTANFRKNIPADAALGFGQKLFVWPSAVIRIDSVQMKTTSLCATGLSATAGEFSLGTVIGSGANATSGALGATAEDILEGLTISNHVAATTLTMKLAGTPVANFDHGAGTISSGANVAGGILNATAGTLACHLNMFSTWDQTAAENVDFQANIILTYTILGSDFGVE